MISGVNAQTKLIHYWHFNNTQPLSGAGGVHFGTNKMNSDYTRPGVTTGYLRYVKVPNCVKDTGYWDNGGLADTTNQRPGFGGCCPAITAATNNSYVRTRNPSDSMQFLWYIPTKNFKNIVLKWGSQASSTTSGQHRQIFDYSLDSGATFITTGLPKLFDSAGVAWGKITLNLSAISSVNNSNKLMLRIKFGAPNTGTSGNNRFDNITVEGDSIVALTTGIERYIKDKGYYIYPNPANEIIQLISPLSGNKTVNIKSINGQVVFRKEVSDGEPIDIARIKAGVYLIWVTETETNETHCLRFIKN